MDETQMPGTTTTTQTPPDTQGEPQTPPAAGDPPETGTGDSVRTGVNIVCRCGCEFFTTPTEEAGVVGCPNCSEALIIPMVDTEEEKAEAEAVRVRELAAAEGRWSEVMDAWQVTNVKEEKMRAAEAALNAAKGVLKAAEAEFGSAVAELRDTIKGERQPRLPFPPEEQEGVTSAESPPALKLDPQHTDEAWLAIHLVELDLTDKLVGMLADWNEAGLVTIGDVAKWGNDGHFLSDIKGIGPAAQKKVEDAIDRHWEAWKHQVDIDRADGVVPEPAEEPDEVSDEPMA